MKPLRSALRGAVHLGQSAIGLLEGIHDFTALAWATLRASVTRPLYPSLILEQFHALVVASVPLVALTALATGAVMALQFGYGMGRFGGKLLVPTLVAVSIVRALGPIFTALMVSARVGAGVAAEIGGMAVTQQVDAIRALGTDPVRKLVVPRTVVLICGLPFLTLLADVIGILGGLIASGGLGISAELYARKSLEALRTADVMVGLGKTAIFGAFIGLFACYHGLRTRDGTIGIGLAATRSVVACGIFIMLSDVFFTKLAWLVGW